MKITDFLGENEIEPSLKAKDKKGLIEEMVGNLVKAGKIKKKNEIIKALKEREELGTTGIGDGVALPHAKSRVIKELSIAFGRSRKGIDFDSLDKIPVHFFFLLVSAPDEAGPYLKMLARISRIMKNEHFREKLKKAADDRRGILKLIEDEDEK